MSCCLIVWRTDTLATFLASIWYFHHSVIHVLSKSRSYAEDIINDIVISNIRVVSTHLNPFTIVD